MRIYTRGKSMLALTLVLLTLVMLVPLNAKAAERDMTFTINWKGVTTVANYPASLTFKLVQVGPLGTNSAYRTATFTRPTTLSNTWTGTFKGIPQATVGGTPYSYSITWPSATGFNIVASKSVAYDASPVAVYTYTGTPIPRSYTVKVTWDGEPATGSSPRPASLNVQLMNAVRNNTENHPSITLNSGNTWTDVFTPITGVVSAGSTVYAQVANPPAGYVVSYDFVAATATFNITLKYNSDFAGTVTWLNAPRYNKPALEIKVGVDGTDASDIVLPIARSDEDCLSFTVSGLTPGLTYVIKSVTIKTDIADDHNYKVNQPISGHNITITRVTDPLFRIGVNMRWIDNNNKRARRPNETTIYLYRDGVYTGDAVQISEASGWYAIFYDQPYSTGSHVFKYSVRAHKIPYYWARCTRLSNYGFLLTQFYGKNPYGESTTTSSAAPKVGDPTLFRTELTDLMRREAANSATAAAALAGVTENAEATESTAVDFDTLKRVNKDVVAWISLADTALDYPILRGSNNTKYLSRLWSGEANSAGSIFMDYHNNGKFANKNTIVYGHNMQNGTMFNALLSYRNQSFYDAHKSISLQTPSGDYSLEPVAGFFTKETYTNVAKRTFNNNAAFLSYVDKCIDSSDFQSEATVAATDKLVTLVTCSNDYNDGTRYLLVCKLTALD